MNNKVYIYIESPSVYNDRMRIHYLNTIKNTRFVAYTIGELYFKIKACLQ